MTHIRAHLTTALESGAVALIQLQGPGARELLERVTGRSSWQLSRMQLADLGGVDQGLAVLLEPELAQLMPHGGVRVVQRLMDVLVEHGARLASDHDELAWPEAASDFEAMLLCQLSVAASPAAIALLLAQPGRWRQFLRSPEHEQPGPEELLAHADLLDRLVTPPTLVITGPPNAGKSTLTNRMLNRSASLVADLPGTTRDWVAGIVQLPTHLGLAAVRWYDTPGLRESDDPIEQAAIASAAQLIESADLVVVLRDAQQCWPGPDQLRGRSPDLYLLSKVDQLTSPSAGAGSSPDDPLCISSWTGAGLADLSRRITELLLLPAPDQPTHAWPWAFNPQLRACVQSGQVKSAAALLQSR